MRRYRTLALGAALLALVMSACSPGGSGSSSEEASSSEAAKPDVSVGSADFYEAAVVGEMYAQALEAKGYTVDRHLSIGERPAVHAAMDSGDINLIPDYLGGLAGALTESADLPSDPQEAWDNLQEPLAAKGWVAFDFSPGTDADGFAVRQETATDLGLETMSDVAAVAVLRDAGEAAARLAPESAAQWFGGALRLLSETAPAEQRFELLLARAGAFRAVLLGHAVLLGREAGDRLGALVIAWQVVLQTLLCYRMSPI